MDELLIHVIMLDSLLVAYEHKHSVIMFTREEWTRGPGTLPVVKVLVWFTNGSRKKEGNRDWSLWVICRKKSLYFSRKVCYYFSC